MPVRILHIVSYMGRGGLETLLMNCFRNIDREQVQFDFLVHRDFRADYDDEIEALGGRIFRLPRLNPFSPGYYKALAAFFRVHPEYRIVHCHLDCMSAIPLSVAKKFGVPVRIAHAHTSGQDKDWKYPLKLFFVRWIPRYATHLFACSKAAGDWTFPRFQYTVIRNGIDTTCFQYNLSIRQRVLSDLNLRDCLVIGHTGRFTFVKNHSFLIDIFSEVHKRKPNSELLLIGTGELETEIRRKVTSLGLSDRVYFLGSQENVSQYLQAMDVFVMPSVYEGFPLVSVEAQCSGLPCFFSDTIPSDCRLTETVNFLPLSLPASTWAEHILQADITNRTSGHEAVRDAGFDIKTTANYLQTFYLNT